MEASNSPSFDSPDAVSQELLLLAPGTRRSVSIFSRKGIESPIALKSPLDTVVSSPSQTPTRQKSRIMRTISSSSTTRSSKAASPKTPKSSKSSRGTILNAVPEAKTLRLTCLEEEMLSSPNEEILSAINSQDLTMSVLNSEQSPRVSPLQQDMLAPTSSLSTRGISSHRRKASQKNRIGVWVNGVAHWDDYAAGDTPKQSKIEVSNMTATRPVSAGSGETIQRQAKPLLSVVIPTGGPLINDDTISNIVQRKPHPNRPVLAITPVAFKPSRPSHLVELVQPKDVNSRQEKPSVLKTPYPAHSRSESTSTSGSSVYSEDDSDNSRRSSSSATSVEVLIDEEPIPTPSQPNKDKPLPPLPKPKRTAPRGVSVPQPQKGQSAKTTTLHPHSDIVNQYAVVRPRQSMSALDRFDQEFLKTSPYAFPKAPSTVSPTLSEAEQELVNSLDMSSQTLERHQLKELVADSLSQRDSVITRSGSVREVMQPPVTTPAIPKRSRKRDWRLSKHTETSSNAPRPGALVRRYSDDYRYSVDVAGYHGLVDLAREQTLRKSASFPATEEQKKSPVGKKVPAFTEWTKQLPQSAASLKSQSMTSLRSPDRSPTTAYGSTSAENVLLHILASLNSTKDLFNTAIINKGMYRVFKENEMDLIRTVTYNQCPTAWELREWTPPLGDHESSPEGSPRSSSQLEHSPTSYTRDSRRDQAVIKRFKVLVLEKCQTFLRKETKFALMHPNHPSATWVNDAFYRIWSFCKIFGSNKGREEDITGQLDWLKGGLLANNQGCVATVNTNLDFDMGSVLLNPPDHFAKANKGGLQQSQLFDMIEIWSSMAVLLQGYHGRVKQARSYGIFDGTGVLEGDVEQEETVLEEWLAYLFTLGPDVVLEMAEHASDAGDIGFAVARAWGWTKWTPPTYNGSRNNFLKEPVSKCYEEQIVSAKEKRWDPLEQELKEKRRQRVANMAAEIRLRRQTSEYQRSPMIDMASERPMSMASVKSTAPSQKTMISRTNTKKRSSPLASKPVSRSASVISTTAPHPVYSAPKTISTIDEKVEEVKKVEFEVEDPCDKAVQTIVAMGFTKMEANNALKITDMGDGIRLDRAVEWCIKQRW